MYVNAVAIRITPNRLKETLIGRSLSGIFPFHIRKMANMGITVSKFAMVDLGFLMKVFSCLKCVYVAFCKLNFVSICKKTIVSITCFVDNNNHMKNCLYL